MDVANFKSEDYKDEVVFLVQKASEAIVAWKGNQLRSINQDRARLEVLEFLDPTCVLIVQDFAMKFIPVHCREAQSHFFGKRGISWHVSVCLRKVGGKLESQTFIHIFQSGLQDSTAVALIMDHVLRLLIKEATTGDCQLVFPPRQRRMLSFGRNHTVSRYLVEKWHSNQSCRF